MTPASCKEAADHQYSDYDSSCSSITTRDSGGHGGWVSDFSFGSSSSVSLSPSSYGAAVAADITSTSTSRVHHKPHKANEAHWEAIRQFLRRGDGSNNIGLHNFRLLRKIGSGDIGNVYLCRLRKYNTSSTTTCTSQQLYAMKVVDREALAVRNKLMRAEMEKEIIAMLDHPFLPTLYAHFDASHYSCLVMEFCPGGDLHAARQHQPGRRFSVPSAKFYAAETLLALEYLHMMGVVYRDLKPENVLVREDGHIMLSDFDLSLKCDVVPKLLIRTARRETPPPAAGDRSSSSSKINKGRHYSTSHSCVGRPLPPVLSCFTSGARSTPKEYPGRRISTSNIYKKKKRGLTVLEAAMDVFTTTSTTSTSRDQILKEVDYDDPELVAEPVNARSKSFVGTHEYLAPEVISGAGHGSAVDWWTLGVFLYELLYGTTPFKGENNEKTLLNIIKQPLIFPENNHTADRVKNISGKEGEDQLAKARDLISRLLVKNPKKRLGSSKGSVEIKRHEFFKGVNWALIRSVRPPETPGRDFNKINDKSKLNKQDPYARIFEIPQQYVEYF